MGKIQESVRALTLSDTMFDRPLLARPHAAMDKGKHKLAA